MAGLEVAGVVLGAIPLIISALEHYSDGVSTIKSMRKYESVFEYLHAGFVTNLAIYRNSLEELLSPLALSDERLAALLEETDASAWDDPVLKSDLQKRLGTNYLPLKSSMKQLNKKILLFAHKLQLDSKLNPPWIMRDGRVDSKSREAFFKNPLIKIRGGFSADKYQKLLSLLVEDIDRIAALTSGAIALEPLRLDRKRKANAEYWNRCQRLAGHLHESLRSRWSPNCSCKCRHQADLRLEHVTDSAEKSATFNLLISFNTISDTIKQPSHSCAIEIEPSENINWSHVQPGNVPRITLPLSSEAPYSWVHCIQGAPDIQNLCDTLKTRRPKINSCIGILNDSDVRHHVHFAEMPASLIACTKRTSMQEILESRTTAIKEKCNLALTLANAVMQFHDTPWLSKTWNVGDIIYLGDDKTVHDQPYLTKRFSLEDNKEQSIGKQQQRITKNATIFALGVALLEMSYGKRLRTFETQDDLDENGKRTIWTDYFIADRLVESIHTRELPNFADATRRCVHCTFDGTVYDLSDDDFRERFYQGVVMPLQRDYDYVMAPGS